jgi:hypothetical protein
MAPQRKTTVNQGSRPREGRPPQGQKLHDTSRVNFRGQPSALIRPGKSVLLVCRRSPLSDPLRVFPCGLWVSARPPCDRCPHMHTGIRLCWHFGLIRDKSWIHCPPRDDSRIDHHLKWGECGRLCFSLVSHHNCIEHLGLVVTVLTFQRSPRRRPRTSRAPAEASRKQHHSADPIVPLLVHMPIPPVEPYGGGLAIMFVVPGDFAITLYSYDSCITAKTAGTDTAEIGEALRSPLEVRAVRSRTQNIRSGTVQRIGSGCAGLVVNRRECRSPYGFRRDLCHRPLSATPFVLRRSICSGAAPAGKENQSLSHVTPLPLKGKFANGL